MRRPWAEGGPQMARTREIHAPTPHGPVRLRVYTPRAARPGPALLYVHGGGWVLFSLDTHDRLMREYPEIVGKAAAGTQNIMTLEILPESSSTPQAQAFREAFVARFPDLARQGRPDLGDALGYGGALVFLEGIKRAGAQPTQQGLVKALESLQGFETGITLPTTFGPGVREGNRATRIVEVGDDLSRRILPIVVSVDGVKQ
ncbi:hydrolase, alpha/beta domain protein [Bordetella bronchiseptica E010]|nr:hydrolase, alpha/beta domain protein [Bordetella bronchiseptica E010]